MKSDAFKLWLATILCTICNLSFAYEQRNCMLGLEATLNTASALDSASMRMSSTQMGLLASGVAADNETVVHLTNAAQSASSALNSALVVSTMRQNGTFKQPTLIDSLVKNEFQGTFSKFKNARDSFVKYTGSLKNATLREEAFQVSQELEKISTQIRACQK